MQGVSDRLGSVVKSARLEKRFTQKELAKRLSITPRYLMSIENRQKTPSCDLLFRIIRELGISADSVFYPEYRQERTVLNNLQFMLRRCDEKDMRVIVATLQSLLANKEADGR
jgi:transcriptional regulator with XRE-family HTH domain